MISLCCKILFFACVVKSVFAESNLVENINFSNTQETKKEDFSLKLGGYIDFQSAHAEQSRHYNKFSFLNRQDNSVVDNSFYDQEFIFRTDSRVYLTASRDVNETFSYGGVVVFNSLINKNEDEAGKISEQNYLFTKLNHGKIELGSMYGSAAKMRVDSLNLARATGGVSGSWWRFTSLGHTGTVGMSPVFILQPMLPNEHGFTTSMGLGNVALDSGKNITSVNSSQPLLGWGSRSNRISYYTPKINGYQIGITYSPNTGNTGTLGGNGGSSYLDNLYGMQQYVSAASGEGNLTNYTSVGISKEKDLSENLNLKLSLTSEFGKWNRISTFNGQLINNPNFFTRQDLKAYSAGTLLSYKNYGLSFAYSDWGDSLLATYANGNSMFNKKKSYYFNSGVSAVYEKLALSLTHLKSSFGGNELSALSLSFDIKPDFLKNRGIIFYIEGTLYEFKSSYVYSPQFGTKMSELNDGFVILTGIKMVF
jgi:hypothetical protein